MPASNPLHWLEAPDPETIGNNPLEFLRGLPGPTAIWLPGKNSNKTRAICTLLHGNEPSGSRAIFHFLKRRQQPCVNALMILSSVHSALTEPLFSYRMLPNQRDLNRCFRPPYEDEQGIMAQQILKTIEQHQPEALLDIHNTSGSGPAFGVSICDDKNHRALVSLFTDEMIVTDLRLGALMEISEHSEPTVTIECGGSNDPASDIIAREGLYRFLCSEQVLDNDTPRSVTTYRNPLRLEIEPSARLCYSDSQDIVADLIMPLDSEGLNYGMVTPEIPIARLGPGGYSLLRARGPEGLEPIDRYFIERNARLYPRRPTKLFMVTTRKDIAQSDCLFYFMGLQPEVA